MPASVPGAPTPMPVPSAILSAVLRPPEDAEPVRPGVTPVVDAGSDEVGELALKVASLELVAGFGSPPPLLLLSFFAAAELLDVAVESDVAVMLLRRVIRVVGS